MFLGAGPCWEICLHHTESQLMRAILYSFRRIKKDGVFFCSVRMYLCYCRASFLTLPCRPSTGEPADFRFA